MGKDSTKPPYRRRYGVIWRRGTIGGPESPPKWAVLSNDGGEDAPASDRGQAIFRYSLLGIFVVFVVLMLLTASGH